MKDQIKLYCKIFGERNTGTNYLQKLISVNFQCEILQGGTQANFFPAIRRDLLPSLETRLIMEAYEDIEHRRIISSDFGWKHAAIPLDSIGQQPHRRFTLFILLTRDPYRWILSLHRRPYSSLMSTSHPSDFPRFLRSRWILTPRDNLPFVYVDSPVDLWEYKLKSYIKFLQCSDLAILHLRYEDLLTNFEKCMNSISLYLIRKGDDFINHDKSTKDSSLTLVDYRSQHDDFEAQEFFSGEDLSFMRNRLGDETLDTFGYESLSI